MEESFRKIVVCGWGGGKREIDMGEGGEASVIEMTSRRTKFQKL